MSQNRVQRTLYRQLLSWCRRYRDVPFDGVPPLTLVPPQVNSRALQRLRSMRTFLDKNQFKDSQPTKWRHPAHFALYNADVSVGDEIIVFPATHNANQLRDVIRSVFWLNTMNTATDIDVHDAQGCAYSPEEEKEQISLAFDAIKSCNQLSSSELDSRRTKRQRSIEIRKQQNHSIVKYSVGQVVLQKNKGWRGVIVGWNVEDKKSSDKSMQNRLTSLTTKQYLLPNQLPSSDDDHAASCCSSKIKYTILVDVNDAALLESSKIVSLESEENLLLVEPCLQRIHNNLISQYFMRFEVDHFVPNSVLSYVYPMDRYSVRDESDCSTDETAPTNEEHDLHAFEQSCISIISGIDKISKQLVASFEQDMSDSKSNCNFLQPLISDLSLQIQQTDEKKSTSAVYSSVLALYHFHVKVNSLCWSRKRHLEHKPKINFSLGQVVKHKLYGYRGVIVAWDHKPYVDVRNWDGLQHVDDPQGQPFYHIVPDEDDCIRAFGGPRSFRYVCQENVESCDATKLAVDHLNQQEWKWDEVKRVYIPSEEMRFLYGEKLDSDEVLIERSVQKLRDILSECWMLVKRGSNLDYFTMDDLFVVLKSADTLEHATTIQDTIKELFKETPNKKLREELDTGIAYLVEGSNENALSTFTKITNSDPSYGEAWNKKATAYYMSGYMQESLEAAQKALDIEPRNFQALAGIGLVEMDSSSYENAVDAFQQCLALNPWSLVSARLSQCLRKLDFETKTTNL